MFNFIKKLWDNGEGLEALDDEIVVSNYKVIRKSSGNVITLYNGDNWDTAMKLINHTNTEQIKGITEYYEDDELKQTINWN
jgi:hypothetical protein